MELIPKKDIDNQNYGMKLRERIESRWLNIFLIAVTLYYLWSFYNVLSFYFTFNNPLNLLFKFDYILLLLKTLYIPSMLFLIFQRKKIAWILLLLENIMPLYQVLALYLINIKHIDNISFTSKNINWEEILCFIIISLLIKQNISGYFNVSSIDKKIYLKRIIIVLVLLSICLLIFSL